MPSILKILSNIQQFDLIKETSYILQANDQFITDLIKDQWKHGEDSEGGKLGMYAKLPGGDVSDYAQYKFGRNESAGLGFMDLIDTGQTIGSLATEVTDSAIKYTLNDDRFGWLAEIGERLLGLNEKSRIKLVAMVRPELVNRLKQLINE